MRTVLKKGPRIFPALMMVALVALMFAGVSQAAAKEAMDKWPKRFEHPKGIVIMYQPQLEDWQGDKLTALAAVSVKKKEWKEPVFGAMFLSARVSTDRDTRVAAIAEVKIADAKFPDAKPEQLEKLKVFLNEEMQDWSTTIALDRLLAALEIVHKERAEDTGIRNTPPKIIFATHPTVLVLLEGDPRLLPVPDSPLMRVANTPFLMLYDPAARTYYLKGGAAWLSAAEVTGLWKDVDKVPEAITTLEAKAREAAKGQTIPKEVEAKEGKMPEVLVSTVPAELLVTEGDPSTPPFPAPASCISAIPKTTSSWTPGLRSIMS